MSNQLVEVIKTYPWQCMECKTCLVCRDPFDEVSANTAVQYVPFSTNNNNHNHNNNDLKYSENLNTVESVFVVG